ncbi:hypothetical protein GW17_00005746 [Ensete ventricosum]|nr:hypothetical protein GW17_00005746 [Ensete ventricosum]
MGRVGPLEPTAVRTAPRLRNDDTSIRCVCTADAIPPFICSNLFHSRHDNSSRSLCPLSSADCLLSLTNGDVHGDAKGNRPLRRPEARDLGPQEEGARLISFFFLVLLFGSGLYSWYSYRFFGDLVFLLCVGQTANLGGNYSVGLLLLFLGMVVISQRMLFSYDALHGVAGIYAKRIFVEELGANESSLLNCTPKNTPCKSVAFLAGSDHIREKDGIWAVLAWLSILAFKNKDNLKGQKLVTVEDIVLGHWASYGRHYYTRYDYEVSVEEKLMMFDLFRLIKEIRSDVSEVAQADEFEYKDPVDGSVSKHQGIRYLFVDGSRLVSYTPFYMSSKLHLQHESQVFRLSGTGSEGATIRVYIEQYENDSSKTGRDSQEALAPLARSFCLDAILQLVDIAIKLSKMKEFTGRSAPTVIT